MKYTDQHYVDADQAARDDLENREPTTPEEYEARMTLCEITEDTQSFVQELLEQD